MSDIHGYLNVYFPVCEGYGWEGGPEFNTQITQLRSGREFRNENWQTARFRYTTNFLNISKDAAKGIRDVFFAVRGMSRCFRYIDALDNEAIEEDFAIGDNNQTTFQLGKFTYLDGVEYFRYVYATRGEIKIFIDNDEVDPGDYVIDEMRGLITFSTPPGINRVISWSGNFDIWVRFDNDYLPFSLDAPNATNTQINLIEQPPPPIELG